MARPKIKTALCDLLEIEYPVMLAGMGAFAMPDLVAAVSNAGGLGVLGATGLSPDEHREAIRRIRSLTNKPFGVDLLLPQTAYGKGVEALRSPNTVIPEPSPEVLQAVRRLKDKHGIPDVAESGADRAEILTPAHIKKMVQIILEERVPVFVSGLGNPGELVPDFHGNGARVMALVGNVRNARTVAASGVDVVIAQGHEAGGHTGRIGTLTLAPQVVDAVTPTLVAAAGGIGDGRGLVAALALGAVGIWCGTVFAASRESEAPQWYKEKCVAGTEEDTVVSRVMTGKTCRIQKNLLIDAWDAEVGTTLPMPLQGRLSGPLRQAVEERNMAGYLGGPAGQVSGMIHEIKPAGQIVQEMVAQAASILAEGLGARA